MACERPYERPSLARAMYDAGNTIHLELEPWYFFCNAFAVRCHRFALSHVLSMSMHGTWWLVFIVIYSGDNFLWVLQLLLCSFSLVVFASCTSSRVVCSVYVDLGFQAGCSIFIKPERHRNHSGFVQPPLMPIVVRVAPLILTQDFRRMHRIYEKHAGRRTK